MRAMLDGTHDHMPLDRRSGRRLAVVATVLVLGLATIHARPRAAGADAPPVQTKRVAEISGKGADRISGRVVRDHDGTAAQGATVILLSPLPQGQDYYVGKLPLRTVTTDGNGEFSFDGLTSGRYTIWATLGKLTTRHDQAHGLAVDLPEPGKAPKPVALRLVAGVAVTTRVKDKATRRPIANATVHVGGDQFPVDATTGRDGVVVLQPLTASRWLVEVSAHGFETDSRWMNLENGSDADTEFLLGPSRNFEGVVRDPAGKPLADVGLSAFVTGRYQRVAYAETDKDGHYRLEHLPCDVALEIHVSKTDYGRKDVPARSNSATVLPDIILEARPHGGSIAGVVLDPKDRPVAEAELVNMGTSTDEVRKTKTGPDGRFLLENLFVGSFGKEVLVRARGFAPKRVKVQTRSTDQPDKVTITLESGHRISGRVVDDKGRPLGGVRVYFARGNYPFSDGGKGTTDAQGRFAFDSLPTNCPFTFAKSGYSEIGDRRLLLDTDKVVTVTMIPAGVIAGKVLDAKTGTPIRSFNVRVTFSPTLQRGEPTVGLRSDLTDPGSTCQSNDGRFKLGDMVVGMPLQVTVSADGYEQQIAERIVVARPDDATLTEFRLSPVDPAKLRTYGGRLLDAKGEPVTGALLRLIAAKPRDAGRSTRLPFEWHMIQSGQLTQQPGVTRFLEAITDQQGRFRFSRIPRDSEVELVWWGQGIAPGRADHLERTVLSATESIAITTPAPARIVGTVDRKAYPGAIHIEVNPTDVDIGSKELQLAPDQSGFEIGDLSPGEYRVSVLSPFERSPDTDFIGGIATRPLVSKNVTIHPGEALRVDFKK